MADVALGNLLQGAVIREAQGCDRGAPVSKEEPDRLGTTATTEDVDSSNEIRLIPGPLPQSEYLVRDVPLLRARIAREW